MNRQYLLRFKIVTLSMEDPKRVCVFVCFWWRFVLRPPTKAAAGSRESHTHGNTPTVTLAKRVTPALAVYRPWCLRITYSRAGDPLFSVSETWHTSAISYIYAFLGVTTARSLCTFLAISVHIFLQNQNWPAWRWQLRNLWLGSKNDSCDIIRRMLARGRCGRIFLELSLIDS